MALRSYVPPAAHTGFFLMYDPSPIRSASVGVSPFFLRFSTPYNCLADSIWARFSMHSCFCA